MSRRNPYIFGIQLTPRVLAWKAATGVTDPILLSKVNTFDLGLVSTGIESVPNLVIYITKTGTPLGDSINFMNPATHQGSFVGGVTHNTNGMLFNGTTGYMDTGIYADSLPQNDIHFGAYANLDQDGVFPLIGKIVDTNPTNIYPNYAGNCYIRVNAGSGILTANPFSSGLYLANRVSSTETRDMVKGTLVVQTVSSVGQDHDTIKVGISGTNMSPNEVPVVTIGNGLTDLQLTNYDLLLTALRA